MTGVSRNKQLFRRSDIYYQERRMYYLSPPIYVFGSVVAGVSSKIFSNNLPKRDLLFPQKPTLNLPMIRPKPTFKSDKSKQC